MAKSVSDLIQLVKNYFVTGHERSIKAKRNILFALVIKGIGIFLSLIIVPMTLGYVNPSRYGIWLTISSIIGWLGFFDIGLTQGLRNKFAESRAKGDDELAQIYVSTTFAILGIIFFIIWLIFILVNQYINWSDVLRVDQSLQKEIAVLTVIVFTYFCLNFVLRIIPTLIIANQQPAKATLLDVIGQAISLVIILILIKTTKGSLINLGLALCLAPLVVMIGANIFFFRKEFARYKPSFSKIKFKYAKNLLNLGMMFFIIQIASIIQFQTANIIISRTFGPIDVTSYNIVYKYFSVLLMVFTIFLTPFWSASTEAFIKNDIAWIKNSIQKYNRLNLIIIAIGILMLVFSGFIYKVWLGEKMVPITFMLSFWGFIYFNVVIFGGKYVNFLNGINALRIQFIASLLSPFIYVLAAILFIKGFHWGVYSLFLASIVANFNAFALAPLQYHKIINKQKRGIWIR